MFWLIAILCQSPGAPPAAPDPPAISLARVRQGLARETTGLDAPPPGVPVFRIAVHGRLDPRVAPWEDRSGRPPSIRTRQPAAHYDFLAAVTPEQFRAATLHPVGVDLLGPIAALVRAIRAEAHRSAEAAARARVQRELAALLAERRRLGLDPPR